MDNLFHNTKLIFEKVGGPETELSDNAEQWQTEVASELFRQAPYVSNYATDIVLDKVDAERGYGYGKATLKNKYDMPQPEKDPRAINIPIIIRDKMLKPFDMYTYENKSYPLSEQRISRALFNPQPLELSDRRPTDKMLTYQMYPPTRSHVNSVVSNAGFGKYASSLLKEIAPTIDKKTKIAFLQKIASDLPLQQAYMDNAAFRNAVNTIAEDYPEEQEQIDPTCIQLKKVSHNTFVVKLANIDAYDPVETEMDIHQVADHFIGDKAYKMAPGQTLTGSTVNALPIQAPTNFSIVKDPGTYQVRDNQGRDTYGAVLPMINFNGQPTGESLFVGPESHSIQEKIAGRKIANEMALPESLPSGYGVFHDPQEGTVTEPVNINFVSDAYPPSYQGTTRAGGRISIQQNPHTQKIAHVINNRYMIPERMKWTPLPQNEVNLSETSKDNVADYKNLNSTIELRSTGDEYSISGRPVEKVANTQFLSRDDAEFLLGAMGIGPEKLAEVDKKKYIKIAGARTIRPYYEAVKERQKIAEKSNSKFPQGLRRDLTKEAAVLTDEDTVDKVLSLGFLNPDNIKNFAGYLPELEKTTNKLADLLFASRCGLTTVPEEAVESAMRNTDQILSGLRNLQEQEIG